MSYLMIFSNLSLCCICTITIQNIQTEILLGLLHCNFPSFPHVCLFRSPGRVKTVADNKEIKHEKQLDHLQIDYNPEYRIKRIRNKN